ncbi:phospholipase A2 inhibitor subunit gamma B-like [Terrapene carolina triunguis]|uniref:phospholipase A2 inhibitor subunit gamma B-like n=1 Tax=Terrapene triunguis TaxID=2587831 RepID=UPI001156AC5B|nr:phospholipase A2 inhibitor subunit gamma B-like [Terrapene carolina triunguis]
MNDPNSSVINPPARDLAASQTPAPIYCFAITMEASLATCILAALLAMGACLQCEVCDGPGTSCSGDLQTCLDGQDSCGVALTEMTWAGMKTQTVLKGCVTSSQCRSGPVSVNFGNGMEIRTRFTCCVGDACRTTTVTAQRLPDGARLGLPLTPAALRHCCVQGGGLSHLLYAPARVCLPGTGAE